MLLLLFLCMPAYSTPIKDKSLDLSKSSFVRNKLITLLDNNIRHQDILKHTYENKKENENNKKGEVKTHNLIDLEPFKKQVNYEDIKLAFNEEAADLLKKLTNALVGVNENLSVQNKNLKQTKTRQIYVVKVNEDQKYARRKRDTNDATDLEVKNTSIVPETENATPTQEEKSTIAKTVVNETNTNDNKTEVSNCNQTVNSRRSFNAADTEVSKAVKARLLSYINEYFNDITTKTNSLRDIKRTFAASDEYSIGYIIANIDTLGINLHNLRVDVEMNHQGWSEKQILDMFDKIKMSHGVVTSLLGVLKGIMDKPPVKGVKESQYLHLV